MEAFTPALDLILHAHQLGYYSATPVSLSEVMESHVHAQIVCIRSLFSPLPSCAKKRRLGTRLLVLYVGLL